MIDRPKFAITEIGKVRFLVFEPESALRSLLRGVLVTIGAREIISVGSVERLREVARNSIDIVILRLTSDRVGEGLVRLVRRGAIAIRPDVPVIVYAAEPTLNLIEAALQAGVDELIALPFTGRSVSAKVFASLVNPRPMIRVDGMAMPDHADTLAALADARLQPW